MVPAGAPATAGTADVRLALVAVPSHPVDRVAVAPASRALSFTDLYQQEFAYVWHALRRLGVPTRHLPDVTQDVFIQVYRRLDAFDPSRAVKPWLFGFAFRVAADHARLGRNRREAVHGEIDVSDSAPSADDQVADAQNRALVAEALAALKLDRRAVLIAHDIDEHPMPEIAQALGVPVKTLYSRLTAARDDFAAEVRRIRLRRGER